MKFKKTETIELKKSTSELKEAVISISAILNKHGKGKSIPRNPLIADTFYLAKDIERWGSGLKRIAEECKTAGVRVKFEKIKSGFQVIFYRPDIAQNQTESKEKGLLRRIGPDKGGYWGVISDII